MNTLRKLTVPAVAITASILFSSSFAVAQQASNTNVGAASATKAASVYKAKAKKLDKAEFDALLAKPDQIVIIDVRRPDELTAIGGFPVYLSIQAKDLEKNAAFIPKDRTIVTVSNHAGRAGAAADLLASKGFQVAGAVGAQNYEEQGGTLAKISPPAPKIANAPAEAAR
ncbi:MAG: rhodanese-like domain-containing protein [Pseudomonadota bacterium]